MSTVVILSGERRGRVAEITATHQRQGSEKIDYRLSLDGHDLGWYWAEELELEPKQDGGQDAGVRA